MKFFKTAEKDKDINSLLAGATAGGVSAVVLNPLDVLHKKITHLEGKKGESLKEAKDALQTYKENIMLKNGLGQAFKSGFSGIGIKALKVGGASGISYMLYNKLKNKLDENNK